MVDEDAISFGRRVVVDDDDGIRVGAPSASSGLSGVAGNAAGRPRSPDVTGHFWALLIENAASASPTSFGKLPSDDSLYFFGMASMSWSFNVDSGYSAAPTERATDSAPALVTA